jgi:hypothetical protein
MEAQEDHLGDFSREIVDTVLKGFLGLYLLMNKILSSNNLQENDT